MSTKSLLSLVVTAIITLIAARSPAAEEKPMGAPLPLEVKWSPMPIRSERQVAQGIKGGEGGQCLHGIAGIRGKNWVDRSVRVQVASFIDGFRAQRLRRGGGIVFLLGNSRRRRYWFDAERIKKTKKQ